jgi:hypothetical protein
MITWRQLEVRSTNEDGTTFTIRLPIDSRPFILQKYLLAEYPPPAIITPSINTVKSSLSWAKKYAFEGIKDGRRKKHWDC